MQADYDAGHTKPLEDLWKAFKAIKELSPDDPDSFFCLGGFHGAPFEVRDEVEQLSETNQYMYWGGYCQHGNCLFPTWHRAHLLTLEEALRKQVPGVTLPFWDECTEESKKHGLPWAVTCSKVRIDGELVDNPLASFTLPRAVKDEFADQQGRMDYSKPAGYTTVRYPFTGLAATEEEQLASALHNAQYDGKDTTAMLNENVAQWLTGPRPFTENMPEGIASYLERCLDVPVYTVFSNRASAQLYNSMEGDDVISLETAHDGMHIAVGGFDNPETGRVAGIISGANGDMGEANTSGLDPLFFFHHCFIDRVFWLWQQRHGHTKEIEIIQGYAGTNSSDSQGPSPGMTPGMALTLQTPLLPFKKADGAWYTSEDLVDIEQLGYTYGPGSLQGSSPSPSASSSSGAEPANSGSEKRPRDRKLQISGIDRSLFEGSFVIHAYAELRPVEHVAHPHRGKHNHRREKDDEVEEIYLGRYPVLSRFNIKTCGNCLATVKVGASFCLRALSDEQFERARFRVVFQHRGYRMPKGLHFECTVKGKPVPVVEDWEHLPHHSKVEPDGKSAGYGYDHADGNAEHVKQHDRDLPPLPTQGVAEEKDAAGVARMVSPTMLDASPFRDPAACCSIS